MTLSAPKRPRRFGALIWVEAGVTLGLCLAPFVLSNFMLIMLTQFLLLALLAISFDLCWGYSGMLSFGQAAFFGLGGYAAALLSVHLQVTEIWMIAAIALIVGALGAMGFGSFLLIGNRPPTMVFVAVGTLTLSFGLERLFNGWVFVGSANGIPLPSLATLAGENLKPGLPFYMVVVFFLATIYLFSRWVVRSQLGLVLAGISRDEVRLSQLGYEVTRIKLVMFVFSGAIAGLAGGLYALHEGFVGPGALGVELSTFAVMYGFIGGTGTLLGPVIGAIFIEAARLQLSDIEVLRSYWPVLLGFIMVIVVVFRPGGLLGFLISDKDKVGTFGVANKDLLNPQKAEQEDAADGTSA